MQMLLLAVVLGCAAACATPDSSPAGERTPPAAVASSAAVSADSLVALADRSRILGDSTAPLWVLIVSDFQCPYCKVWHDETYPALKREFVDRGQIRLAYINLPLPQHQHARPTAELALCAGAQGRFWEYHDAIFDTQAEWSTLPAGTPYFDGLAARAGVDLARLQACMRSRTMAPLVQADYQRGVDAKVRSTPTFMIGDHTRLEGAQPIQQFREAIASALTSRRTAPTTP